VSEFEISSKFLANSRLDYFPHVKSTILNNKDKKTVKKKQISSLYL